MGEIIRLQQIAADREGERSLRECSLDVEDGELLVVDGTQDSGRGLLLEVLTGRREIRGGKLYFRENRLRNRRLPAEKILRIDAGRRMTGELTLLENLRCYGAGLRGIHRESLTALFRDLGIESSPDRLLAACPESERLLLWFALALLRGISVICLDTADFSWSETEFQTVCRAAGVCRARGTATVIFSNRETPLYAAADRIAWLRKGTVIRVFQSAEEWRQAFPVMTDHNSGRGGYRVGKAYALIDPDWPLGCTLPAYLKLRPLPAETDSGERISLPEERSLVYIPEDSHLRLMEEETIGRNLILTLSKRLGTRLGFVKKDVEYFVEQEFRRKYHIPDAVETVQDLTPAGKKFLTLYRAFLLQPGGLLLENPFLPFEPDERPEAADLIIQMAEEGIPLVFSGKDPEILSSFQNVVPEKVFSLT